MILIYYLLMFFYKRFIYLEADKDFGKEDPESLLFAEGDAEFDTLDESKQLIVSLNRYYIRKFKKKPVIDEVHYDLTSLKMLRGDREKQDTSKEQEREKRVRELLLKLMKSLKENKLDREVLSELYKLDPELKELLQAFFDKLNDKIVKLYFKIQRDEKRYLRTSKGIDILGPKYKRMNILVELTSSIPRIIDRKERVRLLEEEKRYKVIGIVRDVFETGLSAGKYLNPLLIPPEVRENLTDFCIGFADQFLNKGENIATFLKDFKDHPSIMFKNMFVYVA